ncbi:MAG: four helix bundle protein [Verrucomicrobiales bacterium]|nr:four helix bundle protein [Verrucomicrobiales bacterium]MBP9222511.1 four helix bundle protein [Verrucomicrobiales bacterium]
MKELRESMVWLKIIKKRSMIPAEQSVSVLPECNELISIFVKSIQTAQKSL